jgi:nucleotide-binding universal stress UspA family protein
MAPLPAGRSFPGMSTQRDPDAPLHRIIVGCDGSPQGSDAAALGALLASASDAGLTLAGVYPEPIFPMPEPFTRAALRRQTEAILRRERDARAPTAHLVVERDLSIPRALRRVARREHADLVILGSAPTAEAGCVGLGRRARQLLHDAPCAAAVAPRGFTEHESSPETIGVGYDGSPEADAALALATALARRMGARLRVHSVVDDRAPIRVFGGIGEIASQLWLQALDEQRDRSLEQASQAAAIADVPAEATATIGDPGAELRALSAEVDILVLGSLRIGRRGRLAIGGTTETVLNGASCPILVVPRPSRARARASSGRVRAVTE